MSAWGIAQALVLTIGSGSPRPIKCLYTRFGIRKAEEFSSGRGAVESRIQLEELDGSKFVLQSDREVSERKS
jgi:hypothetical protein